MYYIQKWNILCMKFFFTLLWGMALHELKFTIFWWRLLAITFFCLNIMLRTPLPPINSPFRNFPHVPPLLFVDVLLLLPYRVFYSSILFWHKKLLAESIFSLFYLFSTPLFIFWSIFRILFYHIESFSTLI